MKIVSLIPSATEIVFALGLGDSLEGVTFECDYPPEAKSKAVVSGTALPRRRAAALAKEIDDAVSATGRRRRGHLHARRRAHRRHPTRSHHRPGPVPGVCGAVGRGGGSARRARLSRRGDLTRPHDARRGHRLHRRGRRRHRHRAASVRAVMHELRARADVVRGAVVQHHRPRTFALEWSDPPFSGGHWVPDMIEAAGGDSVLASSGERSRRLEWDEVEAAAAPRRRLHAVRVHVRPGGRRRPPPPRRARAGRRRSTSSPPTRTRCSPARVRAWSTGSKPSPGRCHPRAFPAPRARARSPRSLAPRPATGCRWRR